MSRAVASLIVALLLSSCHSGQQEAPGSPGGTTASPPGTATSDLAPTKVALGGHATGDPVFADGSVWIGVRHGRGRSEVVRIDPATGSVVGRIPIERRSDYAEVSLDGGTLFVDSDSATDSRPQYLWAVDPRSNALVPITNTKDGVWPHPSIAGDSIWISTPSPSCCDESWVLRLDRETHLRLDRYIFRAIPAPPQLLSAGGTLFVLHNRYWEHRPPILRTIDPATGDLSVVSTVPHGEAAWDLRYERGRIWMLTEGDHRRYLLGLDPKTGDPTVEIAEAASYGFEDGVIWVLGRPRAGWGLQAFDLRTGQTTAGPFGPTFPGSRSMIVARGAAWIVNADDASLVRVDLPANPAE